MPDKAGAGFLRNKGFKRSGAGFFLCPVFAEQVVKDA
jgi:hypothetical protein